MQGGRLCLLVPPGHDAQGAVLGATPTGVFVEPQAAVGPNNDLAAARGMAATAEEKILWRLTAAVSDASADVQAALDGVRLGGGAGQTCYRQAAVVPNNDWAAALGATATTEEKMLWRLTAAVSHECRRPGHTRCSVP